MPWEINKFNFKIAFNKPVIVSELGAGTLRGFHADSTVRFSEEFQESFYRNTIYKWHTKLKKYNAVDIG